jgi:hypothetical protein
MYISKDDWVYMTIIVSITYNHKGVLMETTTIKQWANEMDLEEKDVLKDLRICGYEKTAEDLMTDEMLETVDRLLNMAEPNYRPMLLSMFRTARSMCMDIEAKTREMQRLLGNTISENTIPTCRISWVPFLVERLQESVSRSNSFFTEMENYLYEHTGAEPHDVDTCCLKLAKISELLESLPSIEKQLRTFIRDVTQQA